MLTISQALVRVYTEELLTTNSRSLLAGDVTGEEAENFNDSSGYPCTEANFRLYLAGTPGHKWNQAAGWVFANSFVQKNPGYNRSQVKDYFHTHLRYLITLFRNERARETMSANEKKSAKANETAQDRKGTRRNAVRLVALRFRPPPLRTSSSTTNGSRQRRELKV